MGERSIVTVLKITRHYGVHFNPSGYKSRGNLACVCFLNVSHLSVLTLSIAAVQDRELPSQLISDYLFVKSHL